MKKILAALILISFLAVLLAPMVASAQEGIKECCKLGRDMTRTSGEVDSKKCKPTDTCKLKKDECVGPTKAAAGECDCISGKSKKTPDWGIICLLNTVYRVTDLMFVILLAVAIIFVLIGALTIMMAGGDPERVKRGRDYILYAVIGLIVAFLARAIPAIITTVM